jgi:hypothetical protein
MADIFEGIVEVRELNRPSLLNEHLQAGYRLLAIQGTAFSSTHPSTGQPYVKRGTHYIVGRSADVTELPPANNGRLAEVQS